MILVNRQSKPKIEWVGQHKTPVIIIDDYALNIDKLSENVAEMASFKPDEVTKYPGIRSPIPKAVVVNYLKPLMEALYGVYKIPDEFQPYPLDNYFSLITSEPNELTAMQSWPHFDTPNPNLIAVIHYLDKGSHGGTGFFKHNKTGLDRVDYTTKEQYLKCADDYFSALNHNNFNYCSEQHTEFTCHKKIAYKPNRLIVFPGQLLHSTLIDVDTDINANPNGGRLTANMFISFKA